jgi:hypothetical protein
MAYLQQWQSLMAALINAAIAISVAIWVQYGLTASMKQTDFFLTFTKRYHEIRAEAHELSNKVKTKPGPLDEGDAQQIYFQLFGLMYDEINAYQKKLLDEDALVDWMVWQMYEFKDGKFEIGKVSYQDGWKEWLTTPARYHHYTPTVERIFASSDRESVKRAIGASSRG